MAKVEIYSSALCGYCHAAKQLLKGKAVDFIEHSVERPGVRREMVERASGKTSVPQIFIDGRHVGGFDDLMELEVEDELDTMLGLE